MRLGLTAALLTVAMTACAPSSEPKGGPVKVRVGSKKFTESVILGELATQLVRASGGEAEHRRELGGTRVLWEALLRGEIDVYPEYTGTIREELLAKEQARDDAALVHALEAKGLRLSPRLGFQDTYAIGIRGDVAERLQLKTLTDLAAHPELRLGFSHEFMDRGDGWPALAATYGLHPQEVRGLDHDLAYRGLASGAIDGTDLYSTDAEIRYYGLRVLEDDRRHFPEYEAGLLHRIDLETRAPEAVAALARLEGKIGEPRMIALNARAKLDRVPEARVAADFLSEAFGIQARTVREGRLARIGRTTLEHLALVGSSLAAAILLAVPLGILAARRRRLGQGILAIVGVIQTIPSLALLVFMIPLLGIGGRPAVVALFLYSLLPIVRNTYAGLVGIPVSVRECAEAIGLPPGARLWRVELPMASRSILAGVKTAAVINVGTATLGALVGAGGYGQPILTGIRLDDVGLILEGAVPAALLALLAQGLFELAERGLVPRGLRLEARPT